MTKVLCVIPARYQSTRYPGKPLIKIGEKTMIEWTYERAKQSDLIHEVIVATDDQRIATEVLRFGGRAIMTSTSHPSGTDRIIEALQQIDSPDIILNIQGDEPGIEIELIDGVIEQKLQNRNWEMATAATPLAMDIAKNDPNRVKVVFNKDYRALYFSRSLIPSNLYHKAPLYRHLGIYCYEKQALLKYPTLPESYLEKAESLEQLRALQAGWSIGVFLSSKASLAIDSPNDLPLVLADFKKKGLIQ